MVMSWFSRAIDGFTALITGVRPETMALKSLVSVRVPSLTDTRSAYVLLRCCASGSHVKKPLEALSFGVFSAFEPEGKATPLRALERV